MNGVARTVILGLGLFLPSLGGCDTLGLDTERDRLEEARDRWRGRQIQDYRIDVRLLCFCAADATRAVRVTVRAGRVVSRAYADDGGAVEYSPASFPDVEGLFDIVEDALDQDADELEVVYDPQFGIPLVISIDYLKNAVDEELTVRAEAFTPLTP